MYVGLPCIVYSNLTITRPKLRTRALVLILHAWFGHSPAEFRFKKGGTPVITTKLDSIRKKDENCILGAHLMESGSELIAGDLHRVTPVNTRPTVRLSHRFGIYET